MHFIGLPRHYTAIDLARHFTVEVFRLHGFPRSIISDRDPIFMSTFWKELFKLQGTKLKFSSAYHLETDGQSEVVNRSLEIYLRCFAGENPRTWFHFLHLVEFLFNTSYHSVIGMSPFQAVYGRPPPSLLTYTDGSTSLDTISTITDAMSFSKWVSSCGYASVRTSSNLCSKGLFINSTLGLFASHVVLVPWLTNLICQRRAVFIPFSMYRCFVLTREGDQGKCKQ